MGQALTAFLTLCSTIVMGTDGQIESRQRALAPVDKPIFLPTRSPSTSPAPVCADIGYFCDSQRYCCDGDCVRESCTVHVNEYKGKGCEVVGPRRGNLVTQFLVMGDSPYDNEEGPPLFEGSQYRCIRDSMVPGVAAMDPTPAFLAHIGDIKRGDRNSNDTACNRELFNSRRDLFARFEETLDFLLVPGDNEWNECAGFDPIVTKDPVKRLWRNKFTTPPFRAFEHNEGLKMQRQRGTPENFFFRYSNIAFFGITQPGGDSSSDALNRNWTESKLKHTYDAIVFFAHADLSNTMVNGLRNYYKRRGSVPTLVVQGNTHPSKYCFAFHSKFKTNNVLELTVEPFDASPMLVSLYSTGDEISFAVEETDFGC